MVSVEIKVPVPWGHIAVKAWGDSANKEAIIALHGLLDNAGSFDTLIPLLPGNFYYICVDLPGHGFSSHFPSGLPIFYYNFIFAIQYVAEYFKRQKYILLGHSFGGRLAVLFTQLYPHIVSKIAILDSGYQSPNQDKDHLQTVIDSSKVVEQIKSFVPEETPSYSYDIIVRKILDNRLAGILTPETAEHIARRMVKRVGDDRYEFTYDRRLRSIIFPGYSPEYANHIFKTYPTTCPAISMYSSTTRKDLGAKGELFLRPPQFEWFEMDGHHHSHHTDPELFVPILTKFLLNEKCKL